jgi:hypothetical protein
MTLVTVRLAVLSLLFNSIFFCAVLPVVISRVGTGACTYYRQQQQTLLVPSADASCFGLVEHDVKKHNKNAWRCFKNVGSHKLFKMLQCSCSSGT